MRLGWPEKMHLLLLLVHKGRFQLADGLPCHVLSALVSGLASTTASVPLDTVNTLNP